MQSELLYTDSADRELYSKVKNKEISLDELSIAEIIRLTSFINSEIDKKMSQLEVLL